MDDMDKMTASIRVWMEDDTESELKKLARLDDRSASDYCRVVLKKHLSILRATERLEQGNAQFRIVPIGARPFDDERVA